MLKRMFVIRLPIYCRNVRRFG